MFVFLGQYSLVFILMLASINTNALSCIMIVYAEYMKLNSISGTTVSKDLVTCGVKKLIEEVW